MYDLKMKGEGGILNCQFGEVVVVKLFFLYLKIPLALHN